MITMRTVSKPDLEFGKRIRSARQARGLSLRAVAESAGVSQSFLSQVERGVASPSVTSLIKIADAVDRPVAALLVGSDPADRVLRASERRTVSDLRQGWVDEFLTPPAARRLQINLTTVEPGGGEEEPHAHASDEECVIVMEGRVELIVGGERILLEQGDALLLDPTVPHGYVNPGRRRARVLWVMTPPSYPSH
jgi:transcriptional regulator with XRE-family HTH domain